MNRDDIMILKAALLYIIKKSEANRRDVYGIVKTAFYAQQIHLAKSGSPLWHQDKGRRHSLGNPSDCLAPNERWNNEVRCPTYCKPRKC